jgi:hypothetical protein
MEMRGMIQRSDWFDGLGSVHAKDNERVRENG